MRDFIFIYCVLLTMTGWSIGKDQPLTARLIAYDSSYPGYEDQCFFLLRSTTEAVDKWGELFAADRNGAFLIKGESCQLLLEKIDPALKGLSDEEIRQHPSFMGTEITILSFQQETFPNKGDDMGYIESYPGATGFIWPILMMSSVRPNINDDIQISRTH